MSVHNKPIRGSSASEIARSVEDAIHTGRLAGGDRLPPIRGLAGQLGVSPGTVAAAYRALQGRGLVASRPGSATRVNRPLLAAPSAGVRTPGLRDLASGNPDPRLLPSIPTALRAVSPRQRLYDDDANLPELLELAARRFAPAGIPTDSMTLASGAMDGVERILQAHLRPGDHVAVEDPGYHGVLELVAALGLVPEPVRVDDRGPVPEDLERALGGRARTLIATVRAQNPFGSALDEPRAVELRSILDSRDDVLVVEDDHAGPVAGAPLVALCSGGRPRWAVVHSVAKSLGPDIRLAVVTGDPTTINRVEARKLVGPGWVSRILQDAVVEMWSDPDVGRLLEAAAQTYARRRSALIESLAAAGVRAFGRSGMNVWIPVHEEARTGQLLAAAGWGVRAGEPFRLRSPSAIRVTTASLQPKDAETLAGDIVDAVRPSYRGRIA